MLPFPLLARSSVLFSSHYFPPPPSFLASSRKGFSFSSSFDLLPRIADRHARAVRRVRPRAGRRALLRRRGRALRALQPPRPPRQQARRQAPPPHPPPALPGRRRRRRAALRRLQGEEGARVLRGGPGDPVHRLRRAHPQRQRPHGQAQPLPPRRGQALRRPRGPGDPLPGRVLRRARRLLGLGRRGSPRSSRRHPCRRRRKQHLRLPHQHLPRLASRRTPLRRRRLRRQAEGARRAGAVPGRRPVRRGRRRAFGETLRMGAPRAAHAGAGLGPGGGSGLYGGPGGDEGQAGARAGVVPQRQRQRRVRRAGDHVAAGQAGAAVVVLVPVNQLARRPITHAAAGITSVIFARCSLV